MLADKFYSTGMSQMHLQRVSGCFLNILNDIGKGNKVASFLHMQDEEHTMQLITPSPQNLTGHWISRSALETVAT